VISLLGDATVNVNVLTQYVDAGVTATDDIDGEITSQVITTNTVNTAVAGSYTISYSVTDSAGNVTGMTRVVNVLEVPQDEIEAVPPAV
jgi:hypothetical protein